AQHARHIRSPAANGPAAQAESPANPRVGLSARRDPVEGYLAAFQVRHQLSHAGGEVLFERVRRRLDGRIAVVDFVAVSHGGPRLTYGESIKARRRDITRTYFMGS